MNKKLIWLFVYFIFTNSVFAQKDNGADDQKWLINVGCIVNKGSVIDNTFSTLPYTGINGGGTASIKYQKKNVSHELESYFSTGNLKTADSRITRLRNSYFNFDYNNLYTISSNSTGSVIMKAGGSLNVLYADREYAEFINNNSSFDFAASLSGAAEFCYFFNNNLSGFSISDRINIPLISAVVQPAFGSNNAAGDLNQNALSAKDLFTYGRIASFSSFMRFKNIVSVEKSITRRQKFSLNYTWDYYQISGSRQVKQANHRLGLTYSFIL